MLTRRAGLLIAAFALVAACGSIEVVTPLPAHPFGPDIDSTAFEGTLRLEGRCVYLDHGVSSSNILWPAGYTLKGDPPAIVRYDGVRVAAVGDAVLIGGLPAEEQSAPPGCPLRHVALLGIISTVNGVEVPPPVTPPVPPGPPMTERPRPR
jgi:hypothetical protein